MLQRTPWQRHGIINFILIWVASCDEQLSELRRGCQGCKQLDVFHFGQRHAAQHQFLQKTHAAQGRQADMGVQWHAMVDDAHA